MQRSQIPPPLQRLNYVDVAKGLLIISVLVNHIGNLAVASGVDNSVTNAIPSLRFWCPFFMPAFFVLTGLCSSFDKPLKEFVVRNFKILIVPAFTLLFIRVLLRFILDGSFSRLEFTEFHGMRFLLNVGYWNWFLVAMFTAKLFYWVLCKYVRSVHLQLIVCLLLHVTGLYLIHRSNSTLLYNVWFYKHALLFLIYLFIGKQLKNSYKVFYQKTIWIITNIIIFVAIYMLFVVEGWSVPKITEVVILTKYSLLPHMVMSVTGTLAIMGICFKISSNEYLEKLGRNSLVIYCLHFPIFFAFYNIFRLSLNEMGVHHTITSLVILHIFALNLSLWACRIMDLKYVRMLLGKF